MKKIKSAILGVKAYAFKHKVISFLILAALAIGIYQGVRSAQNGSQATLYTLATASNGTVITTVTGSGQIGALEEVAVNSKVSGALTSLPITDGEEVVAGQLLAAVDATDAARSLQSAEISLAKLEEAPATTTLNADQNNVLTSYNSAWSDMTTTFINLPTIVSGIDDMLNKQGQFLSDSNNGFINDTSQALRNQAILSDAKADNDYAAANSLYKTLTRQSATSSIESLLSQTYTATQSISQAIKDEITAVDFIKAQIPVTYQNQATAALSNLDTWSGEAAGYESTLLSDKNDITQANNSLSTLLSGADALDIQSQKLSIQAARESYDNYFITAPIDGLLSLNVKPTDTVSSGTTIGTIISKEKIATIALNEIDAAKVKVGDKVTLTFDAINDLSIAGHVSDVSIIGTVSQGVVTYNITIVLDTNDDRIKPGMSVNATIVTAVEKNVLTVPNAAIKTNRNVSYVQELAAPVPAAQASAGVTSSTAPKNVTVTVGISNNTVTEILSGISLGDQVIVKTTAGSGVAAAQTTSSAPSIFGAAGVRAGGGGGGGGGGIRSGQ